MLLRRSVLLLVLILDTRPVNADLRDRAMVVRDGPLVGVITTTVGTVEVDMAVTEQSAGSPR